MASDRKCIEYALHAYDIFWDYYKKTLDERNQIINNYIIFVGIPVSIISIFLENIKSNLENYVSWIILSLLIILIFGIIIFDAYIVESFISEKYLHQIKQISKYLIQHYDNKYNKVFSSSYSLDNLFLNKNDSQTHRLRKSFLIIILNTIISSIIFYLFCLYQLNHQIKCIYIILSLSFALFIHFLIFAYRKRNIM